MDMNEIADEEENERKLLADTSDEESEDIEKIDDEVLTSDSEAEGVKVEDKDMEDEDSDGNSDDEDEANEAEVRLIEAKLATDPYDYDTHKKLIEKLQSMGELERLRAARESMSQKYPLTTEIWLSWLRDEIKLAETSEEKKAVIELCERAVNDYLSVEIWLEYLQFSTGLGTEKETTEKIRNIFERALTAAGLHVTKGALIWDVYREFENFMALMMDKTDPEKNTQINRIGKLYKRQLACPLFGMEKTFEEYEIWRSLEGMECTEDDKIIKSGYERALAQLNERIPFEEKIESIENKNERLDAYKAYLTHEKKIGDPARVALLYERAITDISLEPTLWTDYIHYVETNIKIDDITEKIYVRAMRNVPWCAKVWQNWIRFYEKKNSPLTDVQKLIESAFAVGFSTAEEYRNVWMSYLEYLRRRIDKSEDEKKNLEILENAFNRACDHLASFGIEGDPSCEILQFWARTEAIHVNDMEKARSLWSDIMSQGHSESATSWLEYISLERCYGDTKHLRKLFQKALTSVKDWPESIANAWINFERDEGTLEQMEICETKVKERLEKVAEERQKSQQYSNAHEEVPSSKKAGKRKIEADAKWKKLGSSTKIAKMDKSPKPIIRESTLKLDKKKPTSESKNNLKPKVAPPPGYEESKVAPPPGYEEADEKMEEDMNNLQEADPNITVFVSNLDYTATEEEVREALKPIWPIISFRMVKDFKGRSKGFCYVSLSSEEAVNEALKLDRTRINGRPMFISRCDPDKTSRGPIFKYKTELEKNKLFVKGLSPTTTKEDLENIFRVHGSLKDVRIVTYRNGHSKGLAYVEFDDENCAAKALVATDGMTIADKVINVAISQPPQRKHLPGTDESNTVKSLGGSTTSRSHFGNPKTILSMVPRTVIKNVTNNKSAEISGNGVLQPLSNADFRNMLLKK
ncbi:squamous cell carcinoma antigen recognized by T-cells 3 [Nasonia vitripennis]|uniref:RRM domain-containing protein n=1 Tax=Nasonia vitripennis TaxID=7425 RepID=A0A7M7G434_NASVI|nr:squamous cell carcinoma antigen recognized by T-cells 3 [Nasonia vitripennis]